MLNNHNILGQNENVAVPTFKKRTNKTAARKRPATPPPQDDDSDEPNDTSSEDDSGVRIKRRKQNGVKVRHTSDETKPVADLTKSTVFDADRTAVITANDDATKTSHWYTEISSAAEVARATARAQRELQEENVTAGNGAYKGTSTYADFLQKHPDKASRQVGPVKAPTNVRMVTVTDFAPDVCKDYKQTGFCGFGDSCKFLHAREDYAQGWQLDKEWETVGKKSKGGQNDLNDSSEKSAEEKLLESIPFKCIICKDVYKRPVMTKCGHYFCEKCAMTRYMKDKQKTCANCGADTHGTFNTAKKLNALLEKKEERAEEQKAKAREAGGDAVNSSDDDPT